MVKPTKKEILKACELIETTNIHWSCWALNQVVIGHGWIFTSYGEDYSGSQEYADFYNKPNGDGTFWDINYTKENRIIALLLYAEARKDVL